MTAADTFWPGTISPHIASMQFHPWGGGVWLTPCVPLITPISQSWIFKSKFYEKEVLHTELAPYPASMFDATGMMRMATKSTLNNDLRVNVSGRSFERQTTVIYDVSALLWTISWLSNAGTLGDFIVKFESIVKHDLTQGNDVLVFDRYYTNSSKSYMRMLRQEKIVEVVYTSSLLKCPYHLKLQSTASLKIRCRLIRCLLMP